MATGKIKSYNKERNFGFILPEKNNIPLFFFYDKRKLKREKLFDEIRPEFIEGDIVEFDISYNENSKKIASNVKYVKNVSVDNILSRYEIKNEFEGFLKVINQDKILIKEKVTKLKIYLDFEFWEDLEYYKSMNNELFKFELKKIKPNKPKANIRLIAKFLNKKTKVKYIKLFELKKTEKVLMGKVTNQNKVGLFVTVESPEFLNYTFFVKKVETLTSYKINQEINFKITSFSKNNCIIGEIVK